MCKQSKIRGNIRFSRYSCSHEMIDGAGGIFIHNDTQLNLDVILQSMSCDYGRETLNIGCTAVECIKSWWGD